MSAAPAPAPPPPPPRPVPKESGCLPFLVFLLTIACACGIVTLRCGLLPKENAGRVVIEILDKPTKADMKAHGARIRSGAILGQVVKNLNAAQSPRGQDEVRDHLQQN